MTHRGRIRNIFFGGLQFVVTERYYRELHFLEELQYNKINNEYLKF